MGSLIAAALRKALSSLSLRDKVTVALVLPIALALGVLVHTVRRDVAMGRAAQLSAENERARHDTLTRVTLSRRDSLDLRLGDSIALLSRRVVQETQTSTALDRALRQQRVATEQLHATITALRANVSSGPISEDSATLTRHASFDVRQAPYTAHADVALPAPGKGPGSLALRVVVDTARLTATLGCATERSSFGVRAALLSIASERWLSVRVDSVSQSPAVCAAASRESDGASHAHWWKPGIAAGVGVVRDAPGQFHAGPSLSIGWAVFPFGR